MPYPLLSEEISPIFTVDPLPGGNFPHARNTVATRAPFGLSGTKNQTRNESLPPRARNAGAA